MRSALQHLVDIFAALVVDKAESAVAARLLVHHEGRVGDGAKLPPVRAERLLSARRRESANEELVRLGRVGPRNGALRVDLRKANGDSR